ncbi:MAG: response regulator [Alphaproteobacteria bacterium CG11_big_fil_rev_8_21_14_0_20_44_7]|nr:MAG: response regulator [Alphaproteobacteria bacterium CG11_big_fil_rev_8_21_14_0_20_44_7]
MINLFEGKQVEILLVEDNLGDVELTREAFKQCKITNNISVARDGEEALDFLYKRNGFEDAITPDIIFLDLNIPKKDGKQVLAEIKEDSALKRTPVVILTSSKAERDVVKTYNLHANSYLIKPVNLEKFAEVVEAIGNFWFTVVVLPKKEDLLEKAG